MKITIDQSLMKKTPNFKVGVMTCDVVIESATPSLESNLSKMESAKNINITTPEKEVLEIKGEKREIKKIPVVEE